MKKKLTNYLLAFLAILTISLANGQVRNLTKSVTPTYIPENGTATYTFNIATGTVASNNLSFTDNLPSGLRIAATPNVVVTSLTGGSVTATPGGTSIVVSGYSLPANTPGTIRVNVTNAPGLINTSCGSNPSAFTNNASNITGTSSSINNTVGNVCLVVAPACSPGVISTQPNNTTQSVCVGTPAAALTVVASNVTYQWYEAKNSTGTGSPIPGATSATYTPPTSVAGPPSYYFVIVSSSTCIEESVRTRVDVNPTPTFSTNLTTGTQTVCQNVTPTTLSVTASSVTYQWFSNNVNSNTGGNAIGGATSSNYTPPATSTPGTTYYYVVITNTLGCSTASNVRGVTVGSSPSPVITTQPNSTPQNVCVNGTLTPLSVTASNSTDYQWYYSNAATGGTVITISGATSGTYTPPTSVAFATRYYYVAVSNSCGSVTSSPRTPITVNANPGFLTVYPESQARTPNSVPYDLSIVNGGSTAIATYQWYRNTTDSNIGGTLIPGATSATYAPPTNVLGVTYYYAIVASSSGCPAATPTSRMSVEVCSAADPVSLNLNLWFSTSAAPAGSVKQWHSSATPSASTLISSGIVTATSTPTNYWVFFYDAVNNCYSPGSKVVVVSNICCNNPIVDLTSLPQSAPPAGSQLVWYTTNDHTASSIVTNPKIAGIGTYFPFFYDSVNNCYSPVGTPVLVGIDDVCCPDTAPPVNTFVVAPCPAGTANLNTQAHTGTIPSGSTLLWFKDAAHTNPVSDPTAVGAGTYYGFYYNSTSNCYSPASEAVGVVVFVCTGTTDVQVNKTGPFNVAPGTAVTYKIYVTNNGTGNASNVVVKDPAVANFTATSVTCESGWGNGGESTCPGSVTIAELQGSGLIIPSLPNGSAVVFTVNGTAGSSGSITNTATVEFTGDSNPGNNNSTVETTISSGTCSETTYRLNPTATVAANPVSINGGTVNLVYSRDTGVAISGIGESFTIPVDYSFLNNQFGVDNQWQFIVSSGGVSIVPRTSTTAGGIFNALPPANTTTSLPIVDYDSTDHTLTYHLKQGTILPLGQFSLDISDYPALPLGVIIGAQSFQTLTVNNDEYGSSDISSGYLLKPLIQNKVNLAFSASTLPIEMQPGQQYRFRYTAVGNGGSTNGGNRGLVFSSSNYVTFKYNCSCYKAGLIMGGAILDTKVGISALGRAGAEDRDNWPMTRKGGHIALESKTKAFVPNRVAFSDVDKNAATPDVPVGISETNFVEGMMVYDTTNKCLKIYTLKEGDSAMAWHCFTTPACPD